MQFLIVLVILAAVVLVVTWPLRSERRAHPASEVELADLEAAREAKYREIRDAELDHLTGKLSDEDYAALDASLRAEAVAILKRLDRATGAAAPAAASAPAAPRGEAPREDQPLPSR